MHPNDVKELLNASIAELGLPLRATNRGPMLVGGTSDRPTQSKVKEVVKLWMNGAIRNHCIYFGRSASEMDEATTRLASETHRTPEVEEILKSLIAEEALPLKVVNSGFWLEILVDEGIEYRCEDMVKLETLLKKEGLDVPVRHGGFYLSQKADSGHLEFTQFERLANHLAAALKGHGFQVRLRHTGFELQKNEADEVDIAEAKELTYRLKIMVGIPYVQSAYGHIKSGLDTEIHWTSARITPVLPF